jgi:hypothetical protein
MLPGLEQQMLMVYSLDILSHHLAVRKTYVDLAHHTLSKLLMMGRIRQLLMIEAGRHLKLMRHHIFSQLKPLTIHLQVRTVAMLAHALPG